MTLVFISPMAVLTVKASIVGSSDPKWVGNTYCIARYSLTYAEMCSCAYERDKCNVFI